jgi:glycosyltransferase involved in cell wall biosynthesis
MKIALIAPPFVAVPPTRYGGTELVVASLADGLTECGHDVTVYATGDSAVRTPVRHLYDEPIWPPNPWDEANHAAFAVGDIVGATPPFDVVHAHTPMALPLARFVEAPMVYTLHHDRLEDLAQYYSRSSARVVTVAISASQRDRIPEANPNWVVHHGIDVGLYPPGSGRGGYAAFLGRLSREKGPQHALRAARAAGVPLRMAGRPHWNDHEFYAREVEPLLIEAGVDLIGEVGHAAKHALLGGAIATLFPIAWEEPFGLVMIESMLCGTPVIAFPRGAVPEVIDEGETGFIVENEEQMADTLARIAGEPASFDRAACRARAATRFSIDRMVERYLQIYRHAILQGAGEVEEAAQADTDGESPR